MNYLRELKDNIKSISYETLRDRYKEATTQKEIDKVKKEIIKRHEEYQQFKIQKEKILSESKQYEIGEKEIKQLKKIRTMNGLLKYDLINRDYEQKALLKMKEKLEQQEKIIRDENKRIEKIKKQDEKDRRIYERIEYNISKKNENRDKGYERQQERQQEREQERKRQEEEETRREQEDKINDFSDKLFVKKDIRKFKETFNKEIKATIQKLKENKDDIKNISVGLYSFKGDFLINKTFNNIYQFRGYMNSLYEGAPASEEDDGEQLDEDLMDELKFEITIGGGCNKDNRNDEILEKKTNIFKFQVYNPYTNRNLCGVKCIEKIQNIKINYQEAYKQINKNISDKLSCEEINKIYLLNGGLKKLVFVENINMIKKIEDNEQYIIYSSGHYKAILSHKKIIYNTIALTKEEKKALKDQGEQIKNIKRGQMYFDIETREDKSSSYISGDTIKYVIRPIILVCYYLDLQRNYTSDENKEWKTKTFITDKDNILQNNCCKQFLDFLKEQAYNNKYYNVYAHNGSNFDFYLVYKELKNEEIIESNLQLRGLSIINFSYMNHTFKDTYLFLSFSLSKLCDSFKIEQKKLKEFEYKNKILSNMELCFYKPELNIKEFIELKEQEPIFWDLYLNYCKMDCVSLSQIWIKFISTVEEILYKLDPYILTQCNVQGSLTIASLSKKIFYCLNRDKRIKKEGEDKNKKSYNYGLNQVVKFVNYGKNEEDIKQKTQFLKNFKRGGISHCNAPGKYQNNKIVGYDITSQYPSACIEMKIPCGYSIWSTNLQYEGLKGFYHLQNLIFDPLNTYDFKIVAESVQNKSLDWNTKDFLSECYISSYDIDYLKEHYGLLSFDIVKALVSEENIDIKGSQILESYVYGFFKIKQEQDEYKKNKDELYNNCIRETVKLFLNSLTGKFVEDPDKYFQIEFLNGEKDESEDRLGHRERRAEDITRSINDVQYNKIKNKNINELITIGIMVYSYSKRLLFEYIHCLENKSDDIINVETDGLYFLEKHNDIFIENIKNYKGQYPIKIGDNLGNIKFEKCSIESYFLGKKFYYMRDNKDNEIMRIKGISQNTIDEYGTTKIIVDKDLYERTFLGLTTQKTFKSINKVFNNEINLMGSQLTRTIKPSQNHYDLYN